MNRLKQLLMLAAGLMFFSSCTVTEEINLKKDFSGTYSIKINMGDMVTSLQGFGGDSLLKGMNEGLEDMDKSANELNSIEGISNSKAISDKVNHIYGMQFDFSDIDALNRAKGKDGDALSSLTGTGETDENHVFFVKKGKKLTFNFPDFKSNEDLGMGAQMLTSSKYQIIFKTEGRIKKVNNKSYTLSSDGKSAKNEIDLSELLDGKSDFNVTLKF